MQSDDEFHNENFDDDNFVDNITGMHALIVK